ncbi:hypothetical protein ABPG77_009774 [Micractinium sp. CCAP 211/92]
MAALGGLLGAYGSDEEDEELHEVEGAQQTGQVVLLQDDEDEEGAGGLDLSHLTSGAAAERAVAAGGGAAAGPAPALTEQQEAAAAAGAARGDGTAPMDADAAAPEGAAGGDEQPPAEAANAEGMAGLPPEMREPPPGECDPDIQARVANWLHIQRTRGKYINQDIRKSRGYRNPEFFAKMVEHLEIDQYGTSFAPDVFDPKSLPKEDFLDALQREWAAEEERRKAARAAGHGRVEFHKSASNPSLVQPALKPGLSRPGAAGYAPASAAAAVGIKGLPAGVQIQTAAQIQAAHVQAAAQAQALAAQVQAAAAQTRAAAQGGINPSAAVAAAQAKAALLAAQMTAGAGSKPRQ